MKKKKAYSAGLVLFALIVLLQACSLFSGDPDLAVSDQGPGATPTASPATEQTPTPAPTPEPTPTASTEPTPAPALTITPAPTPRPVKDPPDVKALDMTVYLNGKKMPFESKLIEAFECIMMPMKETFELLGWDDIGWDSQTNTLTATSGELVLRLDTHYDFQYYSPLLEGVSPVLLNGNIFVPTEYISRIFDSYIDSKGRELHITTPFLFKDGQWYTSGRSIANHQIETEYWDPYEKNPVEIDNEKVKRVGGKIYFQLMVSGAPPLHSYHLYALDDTGKFKYVMSMDMFTYDYRIAGDMVYYQYGNMHMYGFSRINKANMAATPIRQQAVGREGFSYGTGIALEKSGAYYTVGKVFHSQWEVKPEGLYAIGYNGKANSEGRITDLDLLEETYGYYLINTEDNTHTMVEKLPLE